MLVAMNSSFHMQAGGLFCCIIYVYDEMLVSLAVLLTSCMLLPDGDAGDVFVLS